MSVLRPALLTVTGPTASGKSTVGKMLAKQYGFGFIEEEWAENPHLAAFNSGSGSFLEAELWFMRSDVRRYVKALRMLQQGEGVVLDKPYFENHTYVAAAPLRQDEAEYCHYWLNRITKVLQPPALIVDITATPQLSLGRIATRGREAESGLSAPWFESWALRHKEMRAQWPPTHVLEVSADTHDFLNNPEMFAQFTHTIENMLA